MDELRLKQIEALLDHEVVWSETTVEELVAEVRRLREALEAARPYVEGSVDYPEHSRDGVLEQIDAALSRVG